MQLTACRIIRTWIIYFYISFWSILCYESFPWYSNENKWKKSISKGALNYLGKWLKYPDRYKVYKKKISCNLQLMTSVSPCGCVWYNLKIRWIFLILSFDGNEKKREKEINGKISRWFFATLERENKKKEYFLNVKKVQS